MRIAFLCGSLLAAGALQAAPLIDIYGGAYTGRASFSGDLGADGRALDLGDELGYDNGRQTVLYLGVEHAVPVIPNARLRFASLSDTSRGQLGATADFDDGSFAANTQVASSFDLDSMDLTLYYTPFDLVAKLDIGLTARQLKGDFVVQEAADASNRGAASISEVVPLLYVGAYGKLPLTGFYATGEVNGIGYSGNRFMDFRAGLGWRSDFLFGVELGYSQMSLKIDIDDVDADLSIGGPYLALSLNF